MTGTLNRHSKLRGNNLEDPAEETFRGQRVFCSNRGRRPGCGRTIPLFLSSVIPRHTLTAPLLWLVLLRLLAGASLQSAAQALPMPAESLRGACRRLRRLLDAVRTALCRVTKPPGNSSHSLPLLQTIEHLQAVFAQSDCPLQEYQLRFQKPLMG